MTNLELLEILGNVRGDYIVRAQAFRQKKQKKRSVRLKRGVLTFAAVLVTLSLLCGTAMAISDDFREYVQETIAKILPLTTKHFVVEGIDEEREVSAVGDLSCDNTGYAFYIDCENYELTEENGSFYLRPSMGTDNEDVPDCEVEIRHYEEPPEQLCSAVYRKMEDNWKSISNAEKSDAPECYFFTAISGTEWDSPIEKHYFFEDGAAGSYHITARYFMEASEGHGARFEQMISSFTLLTKSAQDDQPMTLELPGAKTDWNTPVRLAFQKALRTIHEEMYLPVIAEQITLSEGASIENEKFAVYDVDGDGEEELLVRISNSYMAGMCEVIYGYDAHSAALKTELYSFVAVTHYPGMLKVDASHNHGKAGDVIWPYSVYQYNPVKDKYEESYSVDAWDKSKADYDQLREMPFPEDIDTEHNGYVYLITEGKTQTILNRKSFDNWEAALFADKEPLTIPWQKMTSENIEELQ